MLIASERHLRLMLSEYVDHCNLHRRHRHCNKGRLLAARIRLLWA